MPRHAERWPLALLLLAATAFLTLADTATGDYGIELRPTVDRLLAGDLQTFFAGAPIYGPSVLPRVPFIFAADALGAGWVGVYLAGAVACMFAVSGLAYMLDGRLKALGRARGVRAAVILTCLLAPVLTRAQLDLAYWISHTYLTPLGLKSCIRVSISHYNTEAEVAAFLAAMRDAVHGLRKTA